MKSLLLLSSVFILTLTAYSQDKFEREYRLKEALVPRYAIEFGKNAGFPNKVKWFKEEGLNKSSIEAKFDWKNSNYSVEFDSTGQIEDIEYIIHFQGISDSTKAKINQTLDSIYLKRKIQKIQIQFTGCKKELLKYFTKTEFQLSKKYEIVVKGRTENGYELVEYLFLENGDLDKQSKVILKNTDNLEY